MMRRRRQKKKKQKGGVLPLVALVPAGIALGKAVGLGAASGAASYGAKKALQAIGKKRKKRQSGGNIFASATKMGYTLGKRKDYRRMGLKGAAQSTYRRRKQPWLYKKR